MSKCVERLAILVEHGHSLLQRMYVIKNEMENPEQRNEFLKPTKINAAILKAFSKPTDSLEIPDVEKVSGYDSWLKPKLTQAMKVLQPMYNTFREYADWIDSSQKTIDELFTTTGAEFQFETNVTVTADFLDIVVFFAKLLIMSDRIVEKYLFLTMYNHCYTKSNGKSEFAAGKIALFLKNYKNPFKDLRAAFAKYQTAIAKSLVGVLPPYEKGNYDSLTSNTKKPLELLFDQDKLVWPAIEDLYWELGYKQQIQDWVVYCLIAAPEALGEQVVDLSKQILDFKKQKISRISLLMQDLLTQTYVERITGDETAYVHEFFEDLFKYGKTTTFKLKGEKKYFLQSTEASTAYAGKFHSRLRSYLRVHLKTTVRTLEDSPGLLGPKAQLVIDLLHLSRVEILWYLQHLGVPPKYAPKKFKDVLDPSLGEMIFYHNDLLRICSTNKNIIADYNLQLLRKYYLKKITGFVDLAQTKFEGAYKLMLFSFINDLEGATDFTGFRMNIKRVQFFLMQFAQRTYMKEKFVQEFAQTLTAAFHVSKNVDEIDQRLEHLCSLKDLYFYDSAIQTMFKNVVMGPEHTPYYSIGFVELLKSYPACYHRMMVDQRASVGAFAVEQAKKLMTYMVTVLERLIADVRGPNGFDLLAKQIGGDVVGMKLRLILERKKGPLPPGYESFFDDDYVEKLRLMENSMFKLLQSLSHYNEILVYDTIVYPPEFFREKLESLIFKFVNEIIIAVPPVDKKDVKPAKMYQPSVLEEKLTGLMSIIKYLEANTNVNLEECVICSIFENMIHLSNCESPYYVAVTSEPENAVQVLARWYSDVLVDIQKIKILHLPCKKSFVSTRETLLFTYKIEDYFDFQELIVLTRLVGPYGVRCFDHTFLQKIYSLVDQLKAAIVPFKDPLKELQTCLYDNPKILDVVRNKFKGLEKIFELFIVIGGLLVFRGYLKDALEFSTSDNIPEIYNCAKNTIQQFPRNDFGDEKLAIIDGMALDAGLDCPDNSLKTALAPLAENGNVWELLPHIYSVLLISGFFGPFEYNVNLHGWMNNAHLAIPAFHSLLVTFNCKDRNTLQAEYQKYAEMAATLLLLMKLDKQAKNLESCHIFVDKTLKSCQFFDESMWEELHPNTLMRALYSRAFSKAYEEERSQKKK